jgi:aarF domain-containing kinase
MLSLPLTQWSRVLAGARLVASAATKHAAEDATVIASRTAQHGMDLTSKAQQAVVAAAVSNQDTILFPVIARIAKSVASTIHSQQQHSVNGFQDNNNNNFHNDPMASPYSPGRNPYESQFQSHRAASAKVAATGNDEHFKTANNPATSSSEPAPSIQLHSLKTNQNGTVVKDDSLFHPKSSPVESSSSYRPDPYLIHAQPRTTVQTESSVTHGAIPSDTSPPSASSSSSSSHFLEQAIASETQIYPTTTTRIMPTSSTASEFSGTTDTPLFLQEGEAVPSTRVGRALGFASLGVGLAWGTASEVASRLLFQSNSSSNNNNSSSSSSIVASDANADRLAATLCRMRGAALKMGQMLSIQDESLLPPALSRALLQVRQGAQAMPDYQLLQQLESELGTDWRTQFHSFESRPFAAASIGQVHRATLLDKNDTTSTSTEKELRQVVVKVQYPGVARSIESDLRNLSMLVTMTGVAPKGLFIENVIRVGRDELKVECNYINEMANQIAFRELVASDPYLVEHGFVVPNVVPELTTNQVLVTEYAPGGTIDKVSHLGQDERNRIGRTILYLTMKELFEWRLMQTDPNWGNFLYDVGSRQTTLIDFGATRTYDKTFVDGYLRIVWASANQEESTLMEQSKHMGFLTGEESDTMLRAHKLSGFTVGEPFWKYTNDEPFDFRGSNISTRMGEHTSVFLRERLT